MDTPPDTSADHHLRHPLRAFGRWWAFWALFPLVAALPESIVTVVPAWLLNLIMAPAFFWSGLRPMRLWMHRPRPVWLFFFLWVFLFCWLSPSARHSWLCVWCSRRAELKQGGLLCAA